MLETASDQERENCWPEPGYSSRIREERTPKEGNSAVFGDEQETYDRITIKGSHVSCFG